MSRVKNNEGQPIGKADKIQFWTQGFTIFSSQMVRMQNWEQISLQNASLLNVTLKQPIQAYGSYCCP